MSHRPLSATIRLLRPAQVYKGLIVFLPALFHGQGALHAWWGTLMRVALAWMATSAIVYALNDWADRGDDKNDPARSHRPLASGEIGPFHVALAVGLCSAGLALLLPGLPLRVTYCLLLYLTINFAYSAGLKRQPGLQQACIAIGFWLRLISGASPVIPIPLTAWAAVFTLGLAYYLNCLKSVERTTESHLKWANGLGAALAGSLALVALCGVCFARAEASALRIPELPPLFALVAMHRTASRIALPTTRREQSTAFFLDPISLAAMAGFVLSFLWG